MRVGLPALVVVVAVVLCLPSRGAASVFDSIGYDPRGIAMGSAQVASSDDYTAAYFNPSLLVLQDKFSFGYGFTWTDPVTRVKTLDPSDSMRLRLPEMQDSFAGWSLGMLFPLGGKVENRIALGVGIFLPSKRFVRSDAVDPRLPAWYHYQSGFERFTVAASAGVRITDWLSIGGGAQVLGALIGGFTFRLDTFSKEFEQRSLRADYETRVAPLAGFTVDLKPLGLRFSGGYRGSIQVDYDLPTVFEFVDLAVIETHTFGTSHYSPDTFTLGAQYRVARACLAAELRYARWSQAPDPSPQVTFNIDGEALESLGLSDTLDAQGASGPPGMVDTLGVYVGGEYWIVEERFAARAGYSFRPTPVPLQNGETNILDGDTHAISLGVGFAFDDPLEIFAKPIKIEGAYQRLIIPERIAEKESDSDVPSYSYSAEVNALSVAVRYVF